MAKPLLSQQLEALLPGQQCGDCGYDGCRPYAHAILNENAPINRCLPGGQPTVKNIALLLNKTETPLAAESPQWVRAVIDENACIGCTKCLDACPVDAIVGAAKQMHTVIQDDCTSCRRCVEPCPVDCIELVPTTEQQLAPALAASWQRYDDKIKRKTQIQAKIQAKRRAIAKNIKQQRLLDAISRAKAKRVSDHAT